jgi:hypothetical protein
VTAVNTSDHILTSTFRCRLELVSVAAPARAQLVSVATATDAEPRSLPRAQQSVGLLSCWPKRHRQTDGKENDAAVC